MGHVHTGPTSGPSTYPHVCPATFGRLGVGAGPVGLAVAVQAGLGHGR